MIDIHNHLLYGVDDGSKSMVETLDVLKDLEENGFTKIIFTPHYIKGSKYNSTKKANLVILNEIKEAVKKNNINLELYLGNEIFIDDDLLDLFRSGEITTLNNTNFALIELPMSGIYDGYKEIFADLMSKGCEVVLAHPERYRSFQEDFSKIEELSKMGVYFQCNLDSIVGKYGEGANKTIRKILERKEVAFLATDIHQKKHDYHKWIEAKEEILKYISLEEFKIITEDNPSKLVS